MELKLIDIQKFQEDKRIAMIGLSSKGKQTSNMLYADMKKNGYSIFPTNPKMTEYEGEKVFNSINDLPDDLKTAIILTPKTETPKVFKELVDKGFTNIWIQLGANSKEIIENDIPEGVNFVNNECFFMYMEPVEGVHKFHRFFKKLFGSYPN